VHVSYTVRLLFLQKTVVLQLFNTLQETLALQILNTGPT